MFQSSDGKVGSTGHFMVPMWMGGTSMAQDACEIEDARLIVSDKNDLQLGAIEVWQTITTKPRSLRM